MSLNFLVYNERQAHSSGIFSLAKLGDDIVSTSSDGSIKYWDRKTNDCIHTIEGVLPLGGHGLSAAEDTLIGVSFSGSILDFSSSPPDRPTSGSIIAQAGKDNTRVPWAVALSPDASTIAATTSDGALNVYDRASSALVASIETRGHFGLCIDYAPNNRFIASGHEGGGLFTFDTELGKLKHTLHANKTIRSVKFSPDSEILASAGDAGMIALHDVRTGDQIGSITGHGSEITALDWNASGELLATAATDGRIKIWHVGRKECVGTFTENLGHKIWTLMWCKMGPSNIEGFVVGGTENVLRFYLPTST